SRHRPARLYRRKPADNSARRRGPAAAGTCDCEIRKKTKGGSHGRTAFKKRPWNTEFLIAFFIVCQCGKIPPPSAYTISTAGEGDFVCLCFRRRGRWRRCTSGGGGRCP